MSDLREYLKHYRLPVTRKALCPLFERAHSLSPPHQLTHILVINLADVIPHLRAAECQQLNSASLLCWKVYCILLYPVARATHLRSSSV